jgi:hypothetical protein
MARISNQELFNKLLVATEQERIDWQPTGVQDQFTASFGGKWTLIIDKSAAMPSRPNYWIELRDSVGQEVLRLTTSDDNRLPELFEMARRYALKIDKAIIDLMKEIDEQQK